MSEELRTSRVKVIENEYVQVYCPRCEEVYIPKKKCPDVDGAYFGCSFPSLFLLVNLGHIRELSRYGDSAEQSNLRAQDLRFQSVQEKGFEIPGAAKQAGGNHPLLGGAAEEAPREG